MSTILDVENLVISFRTNNGKVQAVRDISFSMEKGETLAHVKYAHIGMCWNYRALVEGIAEDTEPAPETTEAAEEESAQ